MNLLPIIPGERAWQAADRAAGVGKEGALGTDYTKLAAMTTAQLAQTWAEITDDERIEALEVLPPFWVSSGFQVSEAVCGCRDADALCLTVISTAGRHFAAYQAHHVTGLAGPLRAAVATEVLP